MNAVKIQESDVLGARVDKEPQILPDNPVLKTQRTKQVQAEKQRPRSTQ